MKSVVIVQARMASKRFPGKVLEQLGGEPVIGHVLRRCRRIPGATEICCAVPSSEDCDEIAAVAAGYGATVVRGPEEDVLRRFALAAEATDADVVTRVTSDCPLLDPVLCGRVLKPVLDGRADYANNIDPRTWPDGLDCESFTRAVLDQADGAAVATSDREHVTTWLRRNPEIRKACITSEHPAWRGMRWTLDHPADLMFLRAVVSHLPPAPAVPDHRDVMAVLARHPELVAINAAHA